jgi:2-methylaconitate cis-trans-isomerase PrpF
VASSTLLPGSVADGIAKVTDSQQQNIIIEHPSGKLEISLVIHQEGSEIVIERAGVIRTARLLFSGNVYVSSHLWT